MGRQGTAGAQEPGTGVRKLGAMGRWSGHATRGLGPECADEAAGAGAAGTGDSGEAATHRSWCRSPGWSLRCTAATASTAATDAAGL